MNLSCPNVQGSYIIPRSNFQKTMFTGIHKNYMVSTFTFTIPWGNTTDDKLVIFFFYFPRKQDSTFYEIALKLSQILFSGENYKEKYFKMLSAEHFIPSAKR